MIADYNEIQIGASEVSGDIRKYEDVAFASFDEELFSLVFISFSSGSKLLKQNSHQRL